MRKQYDIELKLMHSDLIKMATMSINALKNAMVALVDKNEEVARRTIAGDNQIDDLEKKIEQQALKIIYREQPVAEDLRNVSTALKMVTDIERVGDQAADICEIVIKLLPVEYCKEIKHIPLMTGYAIEMLEKSVKAFVNKDEELAEGVIVSDDIIDRMFDEIKDELIAMLKVHPEFAEQVVYFMMIAKYIERIGDHAVNIAEWAIFNQTGKYRQVQIL